MAGKARAASEEQCGHLEQHTLVEEQQATSSPQRLTRPLQQIVATSQHVDHLDKVGG